MTQKSYPHANTPIATTAQWGDLARYWARTGVIWGDLNNLAVYGDSSGRQVKIQSGRAWVDGVKYENDAEIVQAIAANSSGNTRIDVIALKLDRSANTVVPAVVQGTPSGSPVAPTLTNTSSVVYLKLAEVTVINGSVTITAGQVAKKRSFSENGEWIDWTPTLTGEAGSAYIVGTDTSLGYHARYRVMGAVCQVSYGTLHGFTGTSSQHGLLITLPLKGAYTDDLICVGSAQNSPATIFVYSGADKMVVAPAASWVTDGQGRWVRINGQYELALQ